MADPLVPPNENAFDDLDKTEVRGVSDLQKEATEPRIAPVRELESLAGSSLDHYLIESLVGQGGMGAVYRGRDQRLDRIVAIKVVPITNRKADAMRRFRIEAQSAAKLDHPNIARVYYVGETDRWSYIVFEFIEGINLRQLVLDRGPLSVDDATHFTCQVAEALQHASDRGVVHRDIKPSNILLGTDGLAKIVDMGLARTTALDRSSGDQTASGTTLGTFDYISPEQAHDPREADVRSDIYSLGCTLYYLLTGQPPFPDGTALQKLLMHGTKIPEDPRVFRDDLSDALIAILRKMMAKKPRDRYQSPADLAGDLRMLAKHDQLAWGSALADATFRGPQANRSWFETLLPALLSILLIGAVTLWLFNSNQVDAVFPIPRVEVASMSLESTSSGESQVSTQQRVGKVLPDSSGSVESEGGDPHAESMIGSNPAVVDGDWAYFVVSESGLSEEQKSRIFQGRAIEEYRTLDEALAKASVYGGDCKVLVSGSCVMKKPWRANAMGKATTVALESVPGQRAMIVIDEASMPPGSMSDGFVWFQIETNQVHFSHLDIYFRPVFDSSTAVGKGLVGLRGGARCLMDHCTLTTEDLSSQTSLGKNQVPVFQVHRESTESGTAGIGRISELRIHNSSIRGGCDFVATDALDRLDLNVRESWIAVSGSMVVAESLRTANRSPRVRMELDDSTFITLSPWLKVVLSPANPFPIAVVRVSNQCVYAGAKSLVEWDATDCNDWAFAAQAKKLDDLGRWIDFRGLDNAYDALTLEQWLNVRMSMSSEELEIDSDSTLLRNELGMEVLELWPQRTGWDLGKMHELSPQPISQGTLGFRVGASLESVPEFPRRPAKSASAGAFYPPGKLAP
jgi:serine/threonine protein kinase